jgi:hypothetical protein
MPHVVALSIFAALAALSWYVSVACYRSTYRDGPDPAADPHYRTVSLGAIAAVTLTCFLPNPAGYVAGVVAWAVAVYGLLDLPPGRSTVLVGYLAVASVVARLVVLGVLTAV